MFNSGGGGGRSLPLEVVPGPRFIKGQGRRSIFRIGGQK